MPISVRDRVSHSKHPLGGTNLKRRHMQQPHLRFNLSADLLSLTQSSSSVCFVTASTRCPLCGSTHPKPLGKKRIAPHAHGELHIAQCNTCNLVYLTERPETFSSSQEQYDAIQANCPISKIYPPQKTKQYKLLLRHFARLTYGRKLLDVGCGDGQFVHTAVKEGWIASGIDTSESSIDICHSLGVPAKYLDIFDREIKPRSYDIVTLFDLIEYMPDPSFFLRRIIDILRPGGLIYLTTPNFDALDRRIQGIQWPSIDGERLIYFTPNTLQKTVSRASPNMKILRLDTYSISPKTLHALINPKNWRRNLFPDSINEHIDAKKTIHTSQSAYEEHILQLVRKTPVLNWTKSACNKLLNSTRTGNMMNLLIQHSTSA